MLQDDGALCVHTCLATAFRTVDVRVVLDLSHFSEDFIDCRVVYLCALPVVRERSSPVLQVLNELAAKGILEIFLSD